MPQGLQQIVDQAKNDYNLGIHKCLRLVEGQDTINFTGNLWIFVKAHLKVAT